jgi:hypothetical protein
MKLVSLLILTTCTLYGAEKHSDPLNEGPYALAINNTDRPTSLGFIPWGKRDPWMSPRVPAYTAIFYRKHSLEQKANLIIRDPRYSHPRLCIIWSKLFKQGYDFLVEFKGEEIGLEKYNATTSNGVTFPMKDKHDDPRSLSFREGRSHITEFISPLGERIPVMGTENFIPSEFQIYLINVIDKKPAARLFSIEFSPYRSEPTHEMGLDSYLYALRTKKS